VGYKAELEVWRDRSRKTFQVEVMSSAQISATQAQTMAAPSPLPAKPVATGPIVHSYCFYTDVALRKHWTSNVFEVVSTPGVDQTMPMGNEFYRYLSARNQLTANEQAFCPIYDTRAQADAQWNKTRTLYRFNTVQNNEIVWAPAR
jgi:hypothetical protein